MTSMHADRWNNLGDYLNDVFGGLGDPLDDQLATLMHRAVHAGLPPIAISADVGRFLMVMASMAASGSTRATGPQAVEVGTLAGYSGLWLARGLGERGKLLTVEFEPKHAAFARNEFAEARMADRVEVREGAGLEVLPRLVEELGEGSCDLVFLDAIKHEYLGYAQHASKLLRPGGLLIADNCLGGGDWWIDDAPGIHESRDGVDAFNRWIAKPESGFLACCVVNREGLVVARKA